jgi:outer membrane receptor protein involved in Fe transport
MGVAVCALMVGLNSPAIAQDSGADAAGLEEINVTGSRIQRTGMQTPTPVTSVSMDDLSNMAPGNLIQALNQLPVFFGNTTTNAPGNFFTSPGAGNLNLRGLGPNRTLVLLDGRRVVSSTRYGGTDINVFPEAMIRNVETVTGGASAAYGTDAVAGVVNFQLDTEFTGITGHLQGGITSRGDNENWEGSIAAGTDIGEKMHLLASYDRYEQEAVETYEGRDWYQSWGQVTNPDPDGPRFLVRPNVVSTQGTLGGMINAPGTAIDRLMFLSDGSVTPFVLGDPAAVNGGSRSQSITNGGSGTYNGAARPALAPKAKRSSAFLYLDYDASDNVNVYAQGIMGNTVTNLTNLGGIFQNTTRMEIFSGNPYLPQRVQTAMDANGIDSFTFDRIGGPLDIAANSRAETENTTYSGTLGFKADLQTGKWFDNWRLDGYYQYGRTENRARQIGGIRIDRIYAAADAVRDPATGGIVCNAALTHPELFGDCVPIDLFGAGRASQEAIDWVTGYESGQHITTPIEFTDTSITDVTDDYITEPYKETRANLTQHVAELSMSGEVWDGWAGPVSAAFGASYRKESITQIVRDPTNLTGDPDFRPVLGDPIVRGVPSGGTERFTGLQFSTVANIQGSANVKEVFGEILFPLLRDQAFADSLTANVAARYADYSGSGGIWAYKAGLDWQVYSDLRLRGTYSRDVRAANLSERYDRTGGTVSVMDPEFDGAQLDSSLESGGNPNIVPEKADTITFGAVYQPDWLRGFSLSTDWYQIDIKGAVGQLGVQRIVDDCYNGAQTVCDNQVVRDPVTRRLLLVRDVFININAARARGVDFEASYNTDVSLFGGGSEALSLRGFVTYLDENSITNLGAPKVDRAGETGSLALPKWKATAHVNYVNGPFSLFVQERWIDKGILDSDYVEGVDIDDNSVDAVWYTDMRLSYTIDTAGGGSWEIYGNVNNLFDPDPPVTATFSSFSAAASQTNATMYDLLGRSFTAGVRFRY